jgi:hypothetical protein
VGERQDRIGPDRGLKLCLLVNKGHGVGVIGWQGG